MDGDKKLKRYRQGDVALFGIESLPSGLKKMKGSTIAYGEVTGHSHRFKEPSYIRRYSDGNKTYLEVLQSVPLIHEEHNPIVILPGIYEQITEREYDPFEEHIRTVVD